MPLCCTSTLYTFSFTALANHSRLRSPTPWAAKAGLPQLLAMRCMMGIGEGVAMPSMNNLLSRWIPSSERSRSLALVYSGMFTGSVIGLSASPHLIESLGWPSVFEIFGAAGIVWVFFWLKKGSSNPVRRCRLTTD